MLFLFSFNQTSWIAHLNSFQAAMIAHDTYTCIYRMSSASLVNQKVKERRLLDSSDGNMMRKPAMLIAKGILKKAQPTFYQIQIKVKAAHLN